MGNAVRGVGNELHYVFINPRMVFAVECGYDHRLALARADAIGGFLDWSR